MPIVETRPIDPATQPLPPRLLCAIAVDAAMGARFDELETPEPGQRHARRVHRADTHDVWLIRWGAGSHTEIHDHGGSAGALHVVSGWLVERLPQKAQWRSPRVVPAGWHRAMPAAHVHEVANESRTVAESVHVYSPPLETMHHYEIHRDTGLRVARRESIVAGSSAIE